MSQAEKQELLRKAVELAGQDELAGRLGVSEKLLDSCMHGDVAMPDGKLFVLAAIVKQAAEKKTKR